MRERRLHAPDVGERRVAPPERDHGEALAPRILALQQTAGNQAVTRMLQRALRVGGPQGAQVTRESVHQLAANTPLIDEFGRAYTFVSALGGAEIIVRQLTGKVVIYNVATDDTEDYLPGQPALVFMRDPTVLQHDTVHGSEERFCGIRFGISLYNAELDLLRTSGVAIIESVTTRQATGWFAGAENVVQRALGAWVPGGTMVDVLGIMTATPQSETSTSQQATTDAPSASGQSGGVYEAFQLFNYLDQTGTLRPVPNSGFVIRKEMRDGVLTVRRTPAAGQGVQPGHGDGNAAIKFT
jgi:hypothetical protein